MGNDIPNIDEPLITKIQSCLEMVQEILKANDLTTDTLTIEVSANLIVIYSKNEHVMFFKGNANNWRKVRTNED